MDSAVVDTEKNTLTVTMTAKNAMQIFNDGSEGMKLLPKVFVIQELDWSNGFYSVADPAEFSVVQ